MISKKEYKRKLSAYRRLSKEIQENKYKDKTTGQYTAIPPDVLISKCIDMENLEKKIKEYDNRFKKVE